MTEDLYVSQTPDPYLDMVQTISLAEDGSGTWITTKTGVHILVKDGQSVGDAVKERFDGQSNSKVKKYFHGTSKENAELIRKHGFKSGSGEVSGHAGYFGAGVYFTKHTPTAETYAGKDGEIIEITAKETDILIWNSDETRSILKEMKVSLPKNSHVLDPGYSKKLDEYSRLYDDGSHVVPKLFSKIVKERGFTAIESDTELCVIAPEKISISLSVEKNATLSQVIAISLADDGSGSWITTKTGVHILVKDGQSVGDAVKERFKKEKMPMSKPTKELKVNEIISHLPKLHLKGLKVDVVKKTASGSLANHSPITGRIEIAKELLTTHRFADYKEYEDFHKQYPNESASYSRDYATTFGLPTTGDLRKEYAEHVISHEVGHAVRAKLSPEKVDKSVKMFSKLQSPTVATYQRYVKEREAAGDSGISLKTKVSREQFAEAYRLYSLKGKYTKEFKSLGINKDIKVSLSNDIQESKMLQEPNCSARNCKHFQGVKDFTENVEEDQRPICLAYPDGIPDDIAYGDNLHLFPQGNDRGIVFEVGDEVVDNEDDEYSADDSGEDTEDEFDLKSGAE